jgi:hypothetical protein
MRNSLLAATAVLGFLAGLLAVVPGRAQDRPEPAVATSDAPSPEVLLEHVITHFAKAKTGLRIGMKGRDAEKALAGAARVVGTHVLPLEATPYGLPGAQGTLFVYSLSDEADEVLSEMQIALLCRDLSPEERKALGAKVAAVGRRFGFEMEEDEDEPHLWSGSRESPDRTIYVSLAGKGVILIELSE